MGKLYIITPHRLWDNLYENTILEIINKNKKTSPEELAKELADEAFEKSNDKNYFSPFAKKAQGNKRYYLGGKPDDITIIISYVTLSSNSEYTNPMSENTSTTDHDKLEDYY
jgi:serine/threonine protein phosphatase PrpC